MPCDGRLRCRGTTRRRSSRFTAAHCSGPARVETCARRFPPAHRLSNRRRGARRGAAPIGCPNACVGSGRGHGARAAGRQQPSGRLAPGRHRAPAARARPAARPGGVSSALRQAGEDRREPSRRRLLRDPHDPPAAPPGAVDPGGGCARLAALPDPRTDARPRPQSVRSGVDQGADPATRVPEAEHAPPAPERRPAMGDRVRDPPGDRLGGRADQGRSTRDRRARRSASDHGHSRDRHARSHGRAPRGASRPRARGRRRSASTRHDRGAQDRHHQSGGARNRPGADAASTCRCFRGGGFTSAPTSTSRRTTTSSIPSSPPSRWRSTDRPRPRRTRSSDSSTGPTTIVRSGGKTTRAWNDQLSPGGVLVADPDIAVDWWADVSPLSEPLTLPATRLLAAGHVVMNRGWFPTYPDNIVAGGATDLGRGYETWSVDQFCGPTIYDRHLPVHLRRPRRAQEPGICDQRMGEEPGSAQHRRVVPPCACADLTEDLGDPATRPDLSRVPGGHQPPLVATAETARQPYSGTSSGRRSLTSRGRSASEA